MFVSKKIFIIILLTSTVFHRPTYGHVTIQIEPEDLQMFADILTHIGGGIQHPLVIQSTALTPRCACILSTIKGISRGALQMFGILLTLVGANLLTSKLEPIVVAKTQFYATNITESKILHPKICDHDHGCTGNMCWRTCGETTEEEITSHSWCYTTAKADKTEYQMCSVSHDCSPCWDCLTPCKSTAKDV